MAHQNLDQYPHPQAREGSGLDHVAKPLHFFVGQIMDMRLRPLGQLDLGIRVKAIELQHLAAEFEEQLQCHEYAVLTIGAEICIHESRPEPQDVKPRQGFQLAVSELGQNPRGKAVLELGQGLSRILAFRPAMGEKQWICFFQLS